MLGYIGLISKVIYWIFDYRDTISLPTPALPRGVTSGPVWAGAGW